MTAALETIRSADNSRFRQLVRLSSSARERRKTGLCVLDGLHLATTYCERIGAPEALFISARLHDAPGIPQLVQQCGAARCTVLSDTLFAQASTVATPTGVLAIVQRPHAAPPPPDADGMVLLEDIQDPGNLGSILRSAAAAGMHHVCLSATAAQAWSPRVLRAAMGAHFALAIHESVDLPAYARRFAGRVCALSPHAPQSLYSADLAGPLALALGNEGNGLSPALAAAASLHLSIPMPGRIESLNVAAAAAVCLFELARQRDGRLV